MEDRFVGAMATILVFVSSLLFVYAFVSGSVIMHVKK